MISLRQTGPGGRGRLELELLWAPTTGIRTELASDLLLDLDTLAGLLLVGVWPPRYGPHHQRWPGPQDQGMHGAARRAPQAIV